MKRTLLLSCLILLLLAGCYDLTFQAEESTRVPEATPTFAPTPIPAGLEGVEVQTVVVKKVERPADRVEDFEVISLDGSYMVYYDPNSCMIDDQPYLYGPYNSVKHCEIFEPAIIEGMAQDQAWLNRRLDPYRPYLSCIKGWVYLGVEEATGREVWFVEMFGFHAFC